MRIVCKLEEISFKFLILKVFQIASFYVTQFSTVGVSQNFLMYSSVPLYVFSSSLCSVHDSEVQYGIDFEHPPSAV